MNQAKSLLIVLLLLLGLPMSAQTMTVDYRYAPNWHLSSPALPDDSFKTLVGPQGQLLYHYGGKQFFAYALQKGFRTVIHLMADENQLFQPQQLRSARVPIATTRSTVYGMQVCQEVFSTAEAIQWGVAPVHPLVANREDILMTTVKNTASSSQTISPVLIVNSEHDVRVEDRTVIIGEKERFHFSLPVSRIRKNLAGFKTLIELSPVTIAPGQEFLIAGIYDNGLESALCREMVSNPADALRRLPAACDQVVAFWQNSSDLPYDHITVPDAEIQNLLDASIRGIWQAREIINGKKSFQVGPTCYRGLWIVDGAFLMETAALLGRGNEAREGIEYALSFQKENGEFAKLSKTFWKENGIILWMCIRHALLTQDKGWLRSVWPKLSKTVDYIRQLRQRSYTNATPLDDGLIPPGYIDGGLNGGEDQPEYSNTVWNLAGLKAMIDAARWIDAKADAKRWQAEYDDFYATFTRAARRDMATDSFGNRYLNNMMNPAHRSLPQRALWAFCQSIYPGQIFPADDPIATGTLNMLHTTLQEGMVMGTGWIIEGIWNYFPSFYGHACLWTGNGHQAAKSLYAFANHACPLYLWREEHNPRDLQSDFVGDMPHNWASAEFIRLVAHMLQLDRGDELHLLEGIPQEWLGKGMRTAMTGVATPFGLLSFEMQVSPCGQWADLTTEPLTDRSCKKLVVHTGNWGEVNNQSHIDLVPNRKNKIRIRMKD